MPCTMRIHSSVSYTIRGETKQAPTYRSVCARILQLEPSFLHLRFLAGEYPRGVIHERARRIERCHDGTILRCKRVVPRGVAGQVSGLRVNYFLLYEFSVNITRYTDNIDYQYYSVFASKSNIRYITFRISRIMASALQAP